MPFAFGTQVPAIMRPATSAKKNEAFPKALPSKLVRSTFGSWGPVTSARGSEAGDVHSAKPPSIRGAAGGAPRYPTSRAEGSRITVTAAPGATMSAAPATRAPTVSPFADVVLAITRSAKGAPGMIVRRGNWKETRRLIGIRWSSMLPFPSISPRLLTALRGAEPVSVIVRELSRTFSPNAERSSRRSWMFTPAIVAATTGVCDTARLPPPELSA